MTAGALNSMFGWAFGGKATTSGEVVSEYSALMQANVFACVRVLAEAVGTLTLRTYQRIDKGRSEAVTDPLWRLLAIAPNDEMPATVLWEQVVGCLALCGNAYLEIIRNTSKQPSQIYPLHPLKTEPIRLPSGKLAYRTSDFGTGGQRIIQAADTLHFRLFSWDGLKGLSPIKQNADAIGWSVAALKHSARSFANDSTPPGILTADGEVDEQDLVNVRKFWELANGGENQGRLGVVPARFKYTQLGISAKDAQFLESMQYGRTEIAGIFKVPPHMIGDTSRLSNNNVQAQNLSFVIDTLNPYLKKIEAEIQIKLLDGDPSRFVEFDTSDRLRGDMQMTMAAFAVGRQWAIATGNECREQLGWNPVGAVGDVLLCPVNMMNAERLLDTDNTQDQPIQADDEDKFNDPTPQMRKMFLRYSGGLFSLYQDAIGRVTARSKRDAGALTPILKPALDTIVELIEADARSQFRLPDDWHASDKIQRDQIKSAALRASAWTPETRDSAASFELGRALRSIYYQVYREAGAAVAERGLNAETVAA